MRSLFLFISLLLLTLISGVARAESYFSADMTGAQAVPPVNSAGTGFGRIILNDAEDTITVNLKIDNLGSNNTWTAIHGPAAPGNTAPRIFSFGPGGARNNTFSTVLSVTRQQVSDLKAGRFFFLATSENFPDGEIRGQIRPYAPYVAVMTGANVVPSTNSTLVGTAALVFNAAGDKVSVNTRYFGPRAGDSISQWLTVDGRPGEVGVIAANINSFFQVIDLTPQQAASIRSGSAYVVGWTPGFPADGEVRGQLVRSGRLLPDFDGDGRADLSVFRPSNAVWYNLKSGGGIDYTRWGLSSDFLVPEDFDGDGKSDVAIWRGGVAGQAAFYVLNSSDNTFRVDYFGQSGDNPTIIGDFDGDGKADPAVFRTGTGGGQSVFYYRGSLNNPNGNVTFVPWGVAGDLGVAGDYNGDGRNDFAVFRPSNATWYVLPAGALGGASSIRFGLTTDWLAPADYDGDGKTDIAVYRPSTGVWYIVQSFDGSVRYERFGSLDDRPIPADYDGDGHADVAVWRPSDGVHYLNQSTAGFAAVNWGTAGDFPVAGFQSVNVLPNISGASPADLDR